MRDLVLWPRDSDIIARLLRIWKSDLAVPLLLQLLNLGHPLNHVSLIQAIDGNCLIDEFSVHLFNHVHDLLLDEFEVLSVASWRAADDVVDLDILIISAVSTTIHSIGELDEDRVSLHDALDVLTTDADDTLVVLVRNMEGD